MTGQPAINVGLFLVVTIDAKAHEEPVLLKPIHVLHVSVTLLTGDFLSDVTLMPEEDELGDVVHLAPRGRGVGVEIVVLLLYRRELGNDVLVAVEAFLHRRDTGEGGAIHVRMTELALDILHPGMHLVAEGDGLLRADVGGRRGIEEVKKEEVKEVQNAETKNP